MNKKEKMYKLSFNKIFAFGFALLLCLCPMQIHAEDEGYTFENYDVQSVYHKNNTITVHESMTVNYTLSSHGIKRSIPEVLYIGYSDDGNTNGQDPDKYKVEIKDISVDGAKYEVEHEDDLCTIKIGDANQTVIGEQNYQISYTIVIPADYRDAYDLIYYSVLGSNNDTSIDSFSFDVQFEKTLTQKEINRFHVFSGELGNENNDLNIDYTLTKNGISGQASNIPAYHAITIYDKVRSNYFVGAKQTSIYPTWICAILTVMCGAYCVIRSFTLSKKHVIPVVSFYPPKGMDPASVGYLVDREVDSHDLMALIPYWAKEEYLTIEEKEKETFLHKIKDLNQDAPLYQKMVWDGLFNGRNLCSMNHLPERFASKMEAAKEALKDVYFGEKAIEKTDSTFYVSFVFILLMGLSAALNSKAGLSIERLFVLGAILLFGIPTWIAAKNLNSLKNRSLIKTILLLVFDCILLFILFKSSTTVAILPIGMLVIIGFLVVILSLRMNQFVVATGYWTEQVGPIFGFREFIEKAELDQLERLSDENPSYYYDVIPYAMVFGLSKKWAKKFESIPVKKVQWYQTISNDYTPWLIYYTLDRGINKPAQSSIQNYQMSQVSAASSSSGSFGGFSGGGAGGGGSSRW